MNTVSRVAIRRDGTIVVTDLWSRLGLVQDAPVEIEAPRFLPTRTKATPIGLINHGALRGEEPWVSGRNGTGAIYVHGCPLRCSTCYQPEFFSRSAPSYVGPEEMAELMLRFERAGLDSVSIVIGTFQEPVFRALEIARHKGLSIPIVYKYSGLSSPETLRRLESVVDLFLPDLKAVSAPLARLHGLPSGYTEKALVGIRSTMTGPRRTLVRHLLAPRFAGLLDEVSLILQSLPFAETATPLSLLTHYFDPERQALEAVPEPTIDALQEMVAQAGVRLFVQGRDGYAAS